ncbi:hypothetical protein FA95DRAFT_1676036 [Auriscalpium vulgare]|uniref:Uncharacterized protein n=1 Tax=Auriscalpium vulgare TaxID=40419 RepID=A0ACB8S5E2_9AGAM|nr:hypothetical protein FA95DRAFT_1676036 [Auriscalpium vulgare]
MPDLPLELVATLVKNVDSPSALASLRLANKTLHSFATPYLYRQVFLKPTLRNIDAFESIVRCFAQHVEEVHYVEDVHVYDSEGNQIGSANIGLTSEEEGRLATRITDAILLLRQLPRLHTVVLSLFTADDEVHTFFFRQMVVLGALATLPATSATRARLEQATHDSVLADPAAARPEFALALEALGAVPHLRIATETWFGNTDAPDELIAFWGVTVSFALLWAPGLAANLSALTLHSDKDVGVHTALSLEGLLFPNLGELSLKRVWFHSVIGAEEFIVRHHATLWGLKLFGCKVPVDFADQSYIGVRFWRHIWTRFAEELQVLRQLSVNIQRQPAMLYQAVLGGSRSRPVVEITYVQYDPTDATVPYRLYEGLLSGAEDDTKALERLKAVVNARQNRSSVSCRSETHESAQDRHAVRRARKFQDGMKFISSWCVGGWRKRQ